MPKPSEFEPKLTEANQRLKQARYRVRIRKDGEALYLRATLPPKPGTNHTKPRQYDIAVKVAATPAGLKRAEQEAKKLGNDLDMKCFNWDHWLNQKPKSQKTIGDWVAEFEIHYFAGRGRDKFTETTWVGDYKVVFKHLNSQISLTLEEMHRVILSTEPNTKTRRRTCMALKKLASFAGMHLDTSNLAGNYSPSRVNPRDIPEDKLIVEWRDKIQDPGWKWAYSMLAAYGLRPSEVFGVDLRSLANSQEGEILVTSSKSRTQELRRVYPVYASWFEDWKLRDVTMPKVTGKNNQDLGSRVSHAFKRLEIPWPAYNLRHAYAIRTALLGLDPSIAARWMGHDFSIHSAQYHHWMSENHHRQAFEMIKKQIIN